eukprot:CAMPEP_0171104750 /NCGR_PEP_ID=MMETSP0766_2-20121228/61264_1 /TAXON_ID=439317 /ORGANISM="Gambierdiscus australes, Strain CAWD 149" /LENGTH=54 /DNA_ID=CAMNT_0011565427 /DNA_START=56 /DNA_END=216 /DNA_ORIENTATION=+
MPGAMTTSQAGTSPRTARRVRLQQVPSRQRRPVGRGCCSDQAHCEQSAAVAACA